MRVGPTPAPVQTPPAIGEDDVKVTAVLKPGATLTEETLCRWAIERVPYFAVPRYVEFIDGMPRTQTGKVQKYRLRERGLTGAAWDREAAGVRLRR